MKNKNLEQRTGKITIDETVRRIALFENPVELVNNMYGCHPDIEGIDYFSQVYGN